MSEEITKESKGLSNVPEDVKQLNKTVSEFGDYHNMLLKDCQVAGMACGVMSNLIEHVADMYKQAHTQYIEHEWVKENLLNQEE